MKKFFNCLFLTIVLFSCNKKDYNYEIIGTVYVEKNGLYYPQKSIWYTDTISFDHDTIYYFNSDGSEVRIYPPYILKDKK
jgi:hypothetical protein